MNDIPDLQGRTLALPTGGLKLVGLNVHHHEIKGETVTIMGMLVPWDEREALETRPLRTFTVELTQAGTKPITITGNNVTVSDAGTVTIRRGNQIVFSAPPGEWGHLIQVDETASEEGQPR